MKRLKIHLEPFRFGICCDFDNHDDSFGAIAKTIVYDKFNTQILFNLSKPIPIATIAHELIHALRHEFGKRGFTHLEEWDEETFPYCLAYCLGKILDYCNKQGFELINNEKYI